MLGDDRMYVSVCAVKRTWSEFVCVCVCECLCVYVCLSVCVTE